jgi:uncharacterized membrane protein YdfJ with MMPL/SSD domain
MTAIKPSAGKLALRGAARGYGQPVLGALAEGTLRRPRASLAVTIAALAIAAPFALGAHERLPVLGSLGEGAKKSPELVLVIRGRETVRSPVYRTSLDVIVSRVEADDVVRAVRRGPIGADRRTTALLVSFRQGADTAERERASERVVEAIDPGTLEVLATGPAPIGEQARDSAESDLGELELLAAPVAVLVLLATAGWRFALIGVLAAATGVAVAVALLRLLGEAVELSAAGVAAVAGVALVGGIEAAMLIRARAGPGAEALDLAQMRATAALVPAAGVSALAGLAVLAVSVPLGAGAAAGAALAVTAAVIAALAGAPALASLRGGEAELGADREPGAGRGRRVPRLVYGRAPLAALLLALSVAIPLALAVVFAGTEPVPLDASALPSESIPAEGSTLAEKQLRGRAVSAIDPAAPDDLPLRLAIAGGIVIVVVAGGCFALSRSPLSAIGLGAVSVLPAAGALGLLELVFGAGRLTSLLDYSRQDEPSASAAIVAAAMLLSIAAFRSVRVASLMRRPVGLAGRPARMRRLRRVTRIGIAPAVSASVVGALAFGVLAGSELLPAKELGAALAAGLLLDLVLVRCLAVPALARLVP